MGLEKQFDSFTSLKVNWKVSDKNIADVEEDKESGLSEGSFFESYINNIID